MKDSLEQITVIFEVHTQQRDENFSELNDCTNVNCENPLICYSLYVKKIGSVFLPVWKYHKFTDEFLSQIYPIFKQKSSQKLQSMLPSQVDLQGSDMDLGNNKWESEMSEDFGESQISQAYPTQSESNL